MMADKTPVRPMPIRLVLERGFRYAWESRAVLRGPYLIFAAITIVLDLGLNIAGQQEPNLPTYMVNGGAEILALSFAVGVLRFVLMGETPPPAGFFHFGRNFVRYTISALTFFVAAAAFLMVAASLIGGGGDAGGAKALASLMILALLPVLAVILSRFSLYLPACALGEMVPLAAIWQRTAGNGLRLLATGMIALAPFGAIDYGLLKLDHAVSSPNAFGFIDAVIVVVTGLVSSAQLIVFTIVQGLEYDLLIRGGGPQAIRERPPAA